MTFPEIGDLVRLYPAPLSDVEPKPGRPLPLRRVQDGAGNHGRFLPAEGALRIFDHFWHDRVLHGDVLLTDPRLVPAQPTAPAVSQPPPAHGE